MIFRLMSESDASDCQLGAVVKQLGRPVAHCSRKLSPAQKNHTTIEKELLSVAETLRAFRSMLLGAKIAVFTDHKNLTHKLSQFATQRVMRWRLLLEECSPTFAHEKGAENCVADALSRVPTMDENVTPAMPETRCVKVDDLWTECPWAMPKFDEQNRHPHRFETIADHQARSPNVSILPTQKPEWFQAVPFGKATLICPEVQFGDERLIVLPDAMLPKLVHDGTMSRACTRKEWIAWSSRSSVIFGIRACGRRSVTLLADCEVCARMKKDSPRHGQLAPRVVPSAPWTEAHCDQIGPWEYAVKGLKVKVRALTMVDPVTNLVEIVRVRSTACDETARAFTDTWLSRCPLPERVLHDGGPEFVGHQWDFMSQAWGLARARISAHTPTANAIIESSHRVMGQILRTVFENEKPTADGRNGQGRQFGARRCHACCALCCFHLS